MSTLHIRCGLRQALRTLERIQRKTGTSRPTMRFEPLEIRVLLGATLAATSDTVLLASPDVLSDILGSQPAINTSDHQGGVSPQRSATAFTSSGPSPLPSLPPEQDPLSDVGDPQIAAVEGTGGGGGEVGDGSGDLMPIGDGDTEDGDALNSGSGTSSNALYASVVRLSDVDENFPATPGYFRINVRPYCATPDLPSSVTVSWNLSGTATPSVDYTGQLTNQSVEIGLNLGTGHANVSYLAVDDLVYEQTETVVVTLVPGPDYELEIPSQAQGNVYDNEPIVDIATVQNGAEQPDPSTGSPVPVVFRVTRNATGPAQDPYRDSVTVYLNPPGGDATEGTDYTTLPRQVTIPAGSPDKVFSADVIDDDMIEPHEYIELEIKPDPSYGFANPAQPPKARADIFDNDVLLVLISGRSQNGADNDEDESTGHSVPSSGAGIHVLREKLLEGNSFRPGEIKMSSSDGNDPGNGEPGTQDSRAHVKRIIKDALTAANNRNLMVGMAGYSWGGGLVEKVAQDISNDANFPQNFTLNLTVFIDGVEHGMFDLEIADPEEDRPALTHRHHSYFQGTDDDLNGDGFTNHPREWISGTAVEDADLNLNLDNSASHNLWPDGFQPPGDNRFTHYLHNAPGYDAPVMNQNRWGIDGYGPLMTEISDVFRAVFGRW